MSNHKPTKRTKPRKPSSGKSGTARKKSPPPPKQRALPPHPMQPVIKEDEHDVPRFRRNAIVRALLDRDIARDRSNGGLNWIATQAFTQEDQEQFAQLIGYSIFGYHELSYVSDKSAAEASLRARHLVSKAGCRDAGCPIHGGPLFNADGMPIIPGVQAPSRLDDMITSLEAKPLVVPNVELSQAVVDALLREDD